MKTKSWHAMLLALLVVNAAGTAVLSWQYGRGFRNLQHLQALVNMDLNRFKALMNESIEYSRKNPAIIPVLQSLGVIPPSAAAPAKTTTK